MEHLVKVGFSNGTELQARLSGPESHGLQAYLSSLAIAQEYTSECVRIIFRVWEINGVCKELDLFN